MKTKMVLFAMFLGFNVFLFITIVEQGEKLVQKVESSIEASKELQERMQLK